MLTPHSVTAMTDEFSKIAEGYVRSVRRPISVDRLLEKETESPASPSQAFEPEKQEPAAEKTSAAVSAKKAKNIALLLGGAGTYHVANQVNEDRKLGRAVRLQQQG